VRLPDVAAQLAVELQRGAGRLPDVELLLVAEALPAVGPRVGVRLVVEIRAAVGVLRGGRARLGVAAPVGDLARAVVAVVGLPVGGQLVAPAGRGLRVGIGGPRVGGMGLGLGLRGVDRVLVGLTGIGTRVVTRACVGTRGLGGTTRLSGTRSVGRCPAREAVVAAAVGTTGPGRTGGTTEVVRAVV
jgi:hypothetical protein